MKNFQVKSKEARYKTRLINSRFSSNFSYIFYNKSIEYSVWQLIFVQYQIKSNIKMNPSGYYVPISDALFCSQKPAKNGEKKTILEVNRRRVV